MYHQLETANWGFSERPDVLIFFFYVEDNQRGKRTNCQKNCFPAIIMILIWLCYNLSLIPNTTNFKSLSIKQCPSKRILQHSLLSCAPSGPRSLMKIDNVNFFYIIHAVKSKLDQGREEKRATHTKIMIWWY